jgi:hypothetical protein
MFAPADRYPSFPLAHDLSHQRGLDTVKRPQKPESKVVDAYPDGGSFLDLDPGMSVVEIVSLRYRDSLYFQHTHRPHHRMDGVFVIEVLIEFAPAAHVVVRAQLKGNPSLQVVKTWPLGRRQDLQ